MFRKKRGRSLHGATGGKTANDNTETGDCFSPYLQLYKNDAIAIENEALLNNKTTGA